MDVHGGVDAENRDVIIWNRHNKLNQQWDIVYVDSLKNDPKKGELNLDFGLYVERHFHIISGMASGRYLDINGRDLVINAPNGKASQKWYFDQKSKTIKSV